MAFGLDGVDLSCSSSYARCKLTWVIQGYVFTSLVILVTSIESCNPPPLFVFSLSLSLSFFFCFFVIALFRFVLFCFV